MVTNGADIQPENGFVKIHPAILELLACRQLSGREFRCLMFLFRKTYGYQKKTDSISLSQWAQGTGIPRTRVGDVLESLVSQKLIFKIDNGTKRPATWGFNKHFETWQDEQSVTLQGDSSENVEQESVTPTGDSAVTLEGDSSDESVTLEGDKSVTLQGDNNRKKESSSSKSAEAAAVFTCWKDNMPGTMSSILADDLGDLIDTYGADIVIRAITEAVRSNGRSIRYVSKILENWATGKGKRSAEAQPVPVPVAVVNGAVGFSLSETIGG